MKTCGQCVHFEFALGITGRPMPTKPGMCNGEVFPIAFREYHKPHFAEYQVRPCYHDSQMARQCAAFEEKVCKPGREVVGARE